MNNENKQKTAELTISMATLMLSIQGAFQIFLSALLEKKLNFVKKICKILRSSVNTLNRMNQ